MSIGLVEGKAITDAAWERFSFDNDIPRGQWERTFANDDVMLCSAKEWRKLLGDLLEANMRIEWLRRRLDKCVRDVDADDFDTRRRVDETRRVREGNAGLLLQADVLNRRLGASEALFWELNAE